MNSFTKNIILASCFIFASTLFLNSCKKDVTAIPPEPGSVPTTFVCDTATISFTNDVLPIFTQNCSTSGCHDATTNIFGITLETYTQVSGNISYTIELIKHTTGFTPMPFQSDKLHDTLIAKIDCWIEAGTPNN